MSASILRNGLTDLIRTDGVGPVWCDEHELLQRIFVTVRDENWREIAPIDSKRDINEALGSATLSARHKSDSVEFEWKGTLQVSHDRQKLHFEFTGRVVRDMQVCRVGLVVLHPIDSMIGSRVIAIGPTSRYEFTPSETIAPQPVLNGLPQAITEPFFLLTMERADLGRLELAFAGDLFELEDQRNWGDMSFKTYCTPLRLGFPREVKAGTLIQHSVEVKFTPPQAHQKSRPTLYRTGAFPQLGREWSHSASAAQKPGPRDLPWSHLHFDAGALENLNELRELFTTELSVPLHVSFQVSDTSLPEHVIDLFVAHRERLARLILSGSGASLPSAAAISRWRLELERAAPGWNAPLSAATKGYFVELNRSVPFNLRVSGVAFPLSATVLSGDPEIICENVAAIQEMAQTGLRLTGTDQLSIMPLALYYPPSRSTQPFPASLVAPWLAATLINAAQGAIGTVTLASDILAAIASMGPDGVRLIARLIGFKDKEVARFSEGLPRSLHATQFVSAAPNEPQVLAVNMSPSAVEIPLAWLGKDLGRATDALSGKLLPLKGNGLVIPGHSVILLGTDN